MPTKDSSSHDAPRYIVPVKSFVTVEHPFVVKNNDKAISMIGGFEAVSDSTRTNKPLHLSFNKPGDPTSRNLPSLQDTTDDVLLQITVPKRIGKRKRGSEGPFTPVQALSPVLRDSKYLLQAMSDNKDSTTVEAIGSIQQSHTWRTMPDFDYSTRGSEFLSEIKSKIIGQDYGLLQEWSFPTTYGLQNTEVAPPPAFSSQALPQPFIYHHSDGGDTEMYEDASPRGDRRDKLFTVACGSLGVYPTSLPFDAPKLDHLSPAARKLLPVLREIFGQRPVWSRRALSNVVPGGNLTTTSMKQALPYVAFSIRSGPWSRTLCAYGIDPRSDPRFRKFQTMTTVNDQKRDNANEAKVSDTDSDQPSTLSNHRRSHIFTGKGPIAEDGCTYQLCDLVEAQLKSLVDIDDSEVSKKCDPEILGWYGNGTLSKIRIILRTKISGIRSGAPIPDAQFERILAFPEHYDGARAKADQKDDEVLARMPDTASTREKDMAMAYREGCRNNGRSKIRRDLENEIPDADSDNSEVVQELEIQLESGEDDTGQSTELGLG